MNRNFANSRIYTGHVMPALLDCNFIVDSTNGNGLGIRSLKGPYIQNVFMNTSATPGLGNSNPATPGLLVTNPNPAAGIIVVQLQDNLNRVLSGFNSIVSPLGSSVTSTTAGLAYAVTSLGTATAAQWVAAGVPAGVVAAGPNGLPALGTSFIATGGTIGGGATAAPPATAGSGIDSIEAVGDANQSLAPLPAANQGFGGQLIFECRFEGALTAPANGSVISLAMLLSNSSILVAGE
jgi:hypothetical protein